MVNSQLPAQFSDLERFCGKWLRTTEAGRNEVRISSTMEEIRDFYDVFLPRFEEVIGYLNRIPLDDLPGPDRNLLTLTFSFVEASAPIERFNTPEVTDLFPAHRFKIYEESVMTGV